MTKSVRIRVTSVRFRVRVRVRRFSGAPGFLGPLGPYGPPLPGPGPSPGPKSVRFVVPGMSFRVREGVRLR